MINLIKVPTNVSLYTCYFIHKDPASLILTISTTTQIILTYIHIAQLRVCVCEPFLEIFQFNGKFLDCCSASIVWIFKLH